MTKQLFIKKQESEVLEFKESLSEIESAGETICGFANKSGGTLYFGVQNNGKIIGIRTVSEKTTRELAQNFFDNFEPKIYFSIERELFDNKEIIKIDINKSTQPIHTYKARPFIRVGPTTKHMSQDEYQRRLVYFKSANKDYSSTCILEATLSDLSKESLLELRHLLTQSGRYKADISKISDKQLLKNLMLIRDDQITLAAIILLGNEGALSKFIPQCEIRYGFKIDENELRNQDMEIYKTGYLSFYKNIWEKINSRNISVSIPFELRLLEKKAFDEETVREAVNNAIVHRDYLNTSSILIMQYTTKLVIKSPGGFPEGINIENIINETKPRNKLIADILFKCEMVEQFGNGVNLMYKNQLSIGKLPPNYSNSTDNQVELDLDGKIQDIEFAKYVIRVAEQKNKELSDRELILLNNIKNGQKVGSDLITNKLLELGLIEKVGYGKYLLSKKYYTDTNQKWIYTKRKGLPKKLNKELILSHLAEFNSARKSDFFGLFDNNMSDGQLDKLLQELKVEDRIYFDGKQRSKSGQWRLVKRST